MGGMWTIIHSSWCRWQLRFLNGCYEEAARKFRRLGTRLSHLFKSRKNRVSTEHIYNTHLSLSHKISLTAKKRTIFHRKRTPLQHSSLQNHHLQTQTHMINVSILWKPKKNFLFLLKFNSRKTNAYKLAAVASHPSPRDTLRSGFEFHWKNELKKVKISPFKWKFNRK